MTEASFLDGAIAKAELAGLFGFKGMEPKDKLALFRAAAHEHFRDRKYENHFFLAPARVDLKRAGRDVWTSISPTNVRLMMTDSSFALQVVKQWAQYELGHFL